MALRVGLIGGTGFYRVSGAEEIEVETTAGAVRLLRSKLGGHETYFIPRHGPRHEHVPLRVPHRAHIEALRSARCSYVIGVNNVGSLRADLRTGSWAVPHDLVDLHHLQRATLHPVSPVHTDFSEPYCPHARTALLEASGGRSVIYVGVDGPRFETRAEVRWMASIGGDVVGMTGVPEATLAHEAGLCYGSLCLVGNAASGLGERSTAQEIQAQMVRRRAGLMRVLGEAFRRLSGRKTCRCREHAVPLMAEGR